MNKLFALLCTFILINQSQAQDLFVKQTVSNTTQPQSRVNLVLLNDGGSLSCANYLDGKANKSIVVHRYSTCGDVLWSKSIEHTESINLADMQVDSLDNILLVGYLSSTTSNNTPFLISLSAEGNLNFFKRYNVNSNLGHYVYSIGISPSNEYYIYINYNTSTAGPQARVSLLKLDHFGAVKWYKIYNYFSWHYGFMIATSDGGVLVNMGIDLIKIDFEGNVEWINKYDGRELYKPIETADGFAFSYFMSNSILNPHLLMLNKDGSFKWNIKDFDFIAARKGITRNNGNLLFVGNVKQSSSEIGFMELNPSNGQLVNYKSIEISGTQVDDLLEDKHGNVFLSGSRNNRMLLAKLNDTLSTLACNSKTLNAGYVFDTLVQSSINTVGSTLNQVSVVDEQFTETDVNTSATTFCAYTESPIPPDLGLDTSICPGTTLTLGDANWNYAAYQWSTGESSKTINITSAGEYRLYVVSACDTLRDTITVSHFPSLSPQFDVLPKQVMTNDTIRFRNLTANSFNPKWGMGDGREYFVDTLYATYAISGNYEVTLSIESSDGCVFTTSDFVNILPSDYSIPNVFSPNKDGVNDVFKPVGDDVVGFDMKVFNRWGAEVFISKNISWDGYTMNGEPAVAASYFYKLEIYFNNGKRVQEKGMLNLLR